MRSQTPSAAHVVILVGIPGAGKSFFAEYFAKAFNAPLVNIHTIANTLDVDESSAVKVGDMLLGELFKTGRTLVYEGPTTTKQQPQNNNHKTTTTNNDNHHNTPQLHTHFLQKASTRMDACVQLTF